MNPRFDIEFLPRRQPRWVGWALLGLAVFAVLEIDVRQQELLDELAVWEGTSQRAEVMTGTGRSESAQDALGQAGMVVEQLALPWSPLFGALERAHLDTVALLAVQPDAQRRTLTLSGEAKSYSDVLEYSSRLRSEARLSNVYLVSNEAKDDLPQRPVAFTITAEWRSVR